MLGALLAAILSTTALAAQRCSEQPLGTLELKVEPAFPGLEFEKPLYLTQAPDGRFFVVEQGGRVWAVKDGKKTLFLDLSERTHASGERGLLGLALHPGFAKNGLFFVYYSDLKTKVRGIDHRAVLSRFKAGDPASERVLFTVDQPFSNHNGGGLQFGPDGKLYLGLGDGGSAGDPLGNAQNPESFLGKMLRFDLSAKDLKPEIFASGLRNPWRFSFDRATGALWAGDVGQNELEEIDLVEKGKNYGWNHYEGNKPYFGAEAADPRRFTPPIVQYEQKLGGRSVTGGYVYRGKAFPALSGVYFYGDYTSGRLRGLCYEDGKVVEDRQLLATGLAISSFGEDAEGELYVTAFDGKVYRLGQAQ